MSDDTTPTGSPFNLKPDGRVSTTWKVLGAIIVATAVLVGGIVSVKQDLATATAKAQEALTVVKEVQADLVQIKVALGLWDPRMTGHSLPKPPTGASP